MLKSLLYAVLVFAAFVAVFLVALYGVKPMALRVKYHTHLALLWCSRFLLPPGFVVISEHDCDRIATRASRIASLLRKKQVFANRHGHVPRAGTTARLLWIACDELAAGAYMARYRRPKAPDKLPARFQWSKSYREAMGEAAARVAGVLDA